MQALRPPAVGVGLFAILLLTYSAVIVTEYAVTDDYFVLAKAKKGETLRRDPTALSQAKRGEPSLVASLARGCVTSALLTAVVFEEARDIANLRYARLIGLLGLGFVAYLLYRALTYSGWPPGRSAALAVLLLTTPPFQVCASWSISFTVSWSCAATGVAWWLTNRAAEPGPSLARRALLIAGALVMLFLAVTVYQVTLMYFIVFCAIDLFRPEGHFERVRTRLVPYTLVMGGGLGLGFLAYKVGVAVYGKWLSAGRAEMVSDYGEKLLYFVLNPLRVALNLHSLEESPRIAVIVGALLVVGLLLYFQGSWLRRLAMLALAVALVPGIYLPNLLAAENWAAFRTQLGLTSLLVLYAFLAAHGFARLLRATFALRYLLPAAAAAAALGAADSVSRHYVEPQRVELGLVRHQISKMNLDGVKAVNVVGPQWGNWIGHSHWDELGLPSTFPIWARSAMVWVVFHEKLGRPPYFPIQLAPGSIAKNLPANERMIDMGELVRYR